MNLVDAAKQALAEGDVIGLPTDTVYGLAADPKIRAGMNLLFELKGRPAGKPIGLLVASIEQAREIVKLDGEAADLAEKHWPGPLTLVAAPVVVLPVWVGHGRIRSVGIRVPDHPAALEVLRTTGPLAVTSANRSGGAETYSDVEAEKVFGDEVAVWVPGDCPGGQASTVVDVTGRSPTLLRPGPIAL